MDSRRGHLHLLRCRFRCHLTHRHIRCSVWGFYRGCSVCSQHVRSSAQVVNIDNLEAEFGGETYLLVAFDAMWVRKSARMNVTCTVSQLISSVGRAVDGLVGGS